MEETPQDLEHLLDYLKATRGFDFTRYKRSTLFRRADKRRKEVGAKGFADYQDYLEVHPGEFAQLFNTILINVTGFFRDGPAWEFLAAEIIPKIVGPAGSREPIRVWSAGTATGEEVYTTAILLAEALGPEAYRTRVKIYATDVDEDALAIARAAEYSSEALDDVPEPLREKYFQLHGSRYLFRPDLRRNLAFGRHDLVADAPISRVSLLVCRNTLMYFNADAQAAMLGHLHFALKDDGYLFLGRAEMLLSHPQLFAPVNLKQRIFAKVRGQRPAERMPVPAAVESPPDDPDQRLRAAVMDKVALAAIAVDREGVLVTTNEEARSLLSISTHDHGRQLSDLEVAYRPADLLPLIDQAYVQGKPVTRSNVERVLRGGAKFFDVQVVPLFAHDGESLGVLVMFTDITAFNTLRAELVHSRQELETAYEELQSTNEELETTNEELQSTVEELETTNEELQSANEELETINEELQSTNTELEAVNERISERSEEVTDAHSLSESILATLRSGVVVLDGSLVVRRWSRRCEELWGLRAEEVLGLPYESLEIGLPVAETMPAIRASWERREHVEVSVEATNRRGKRITVVVTCTPLLGADQTPNGLVVAMDGGG